MFRSKHHIYIVPCSWFKFPTETTFKKKSKLQANETQPALLASIKLVSTVIRTREDGSPGLSWCSNIFERRCLPTLFPHQMCVMGVQETKLKGDGAVDLGEGFKMLRAVGDGKTNGVGVIMNEEYSKEVIRVEKWGGRIIAVWILVGGQMMCILSVYAPQTRKT